MKRIHIGLIAGWVLLGSAVHLTAATVTYNGSLSYVEDDESGFVAKAAALENSWRQLSVLSWKVSNEEPGAPEGYPWHYSYSLEVYKFAPVTWMIETGTEFTAGDITALTVTGTYASEDFTVEVGTWVKEGDSRGDFLREMPKQTHGLLIRDTSSGGGETSGTITISFWSKYAPGWGDLYANCGGNGNRGWNEGFASNSNDPIDPPADGTVENHVLVPYEGSPALAVISAVWSRIVDGVPVISWTVEMEIGTMGYYLERWNDGAWVRVNERMIPAMFFEPTPKDYAQADPTAPLGTTQRYRIVELDSQGRLLTYGPYDLVLDDDEISYDTWTAGIDWGDADSSPDADPDGDGLTNFHEYLAGTNPLDADSVLSLTSIRPVAEGIRLTWSSEPDRVYAIATSTSPDGPFLPVVGGIEATPPENIAVLPLDAANGPSAFFRIIVSQP